MKAMKVFWRGGLKTHIGNISVVNCIFAINPLLTGQS
jgi:hypothetical protein